MRAIFGTITFVAAAWVVASAPTLSVGPGIIVDTRQQDYYRNTRSQYPQYVSPCALAAASAPIPAVAPPAYQLNIAPYQVPQASQQYGYEAPHYRAMELEPEIMNYSDMDHMMSEHVPMARYGYAAPAAAHAPYVQAPSTSGPVFGVFPNAKTGGCNVPLLFSCTPSVVSGHVVQSQPQYNAVPDSYRGVEPLAHHDSQVSHEEPSVHEHLNPAHESSQTMVHQ